MEVSNFFLHMNADISLDFKNHRYLRDIKIIIHVVVENARFFSVTKFKFIHP